MCALAAIFTLACLPAFSPQSVAVHASGAVNATISGMRCAFSTHWCLLLADVDAMRLADLPMLLTDYRRLTLSQAGGPASAAAAFVLDAAGEPVGNDSTAAGAPVVSDSTAAGRLLHLTPFDLRLSDLPALLASYRALLPTAAM